MKMFILEQSLLNVKSYVLADKDPSRGTYNLVGHPAFATAFTTQDDATSWLTLNVCSQDHKFFAAVGRSDTLDAFVSWYDHGMPMGSCETLSTSLSRKYNGETGRELLDWWFNYNKVDSDRVISYDCCKTWPKPYSVFKHIWEIRGYWDSEYKNKEIRLCVYTRRDANFDEFKQELELGLDVIGASGPVNIDVFDHYLSEYGNSVCLQRDEKGEWSVKSRIGPHHLGSLRSVFDYLVEERWYE
jgi:hypothetical protein